MDQSSLPAIQRVRAGSATSDCAEQRDPGRAGALCRLVRRGPLSHRGRNRRRGVFRRLHLVEKTWSDAIELVILNIRGPRIAAALLVGAALATAGAAYQHLFRNPLVSPAVLGVSAGAGFEPRWACSSAYARPGVQGWPFSVATPP